jgi:hypothetical protein
MHGLIDAGITCSKTRGAKLFHADKLTWLMHTRQKILTYKLHIVHASERNIETPYVMMVDRKAIRKSTEHLNENTRPLARPSKVYTGNE